MKKVLTCLILVVTFMLASCGQQDLQIEVTNDLYYSEGKSSTIEVKITENNEPVSGLEVNAQFAMSRMDHGTIEASFTEVEDGVYGAEVELPMAGEWEIAFTMKDDKKSVEKVIVYEVEEAEGVAAINGQWITDEDLNFYSFINELEIAISREIAKEKYSGKKLEDALRHLDDQEEMMKDKNNLLLQIIRLRAIALLGDEKGHTATNEEIEEQLKNEREKYNQYDIAKRMIQEYGEEAFWKKEEEQFEKIILTQKVQHDLINQVKEENPNVNEQEIMYLAEKHYDELLVSQVNSLDVEIF